jgi:hypothetical protein
MTSRVPLGAKSRVGEGPVTTAEEHTLYKVLSNSDVSIGAPAAQSTDPT